MKKSTRFVLFTSAMFVGIAFVVRVAFALNFSGHKSINGLQNFSLFKAPAAGIYFVKGVLSLPQPSTTGGTQVSAAQAVVYKNVVSGAGVIYIGVSGANGFSIPSLSLEANDTISVSVTSNASVDMGINAVRGDVFFGNGM